MPIAVVSEEPEHFDLKSLPGGYVKIRRMTYGEKLTSRKFTGKMEVTAQRGSKDIKSMLDVFNEQSDLYGFAKCVVEHNLTDVDDRPLNFASSDDVKKLSNRIAEEIGSYIDKVNNFEDDEEVGKLPEPSAQA